MKKVLTVAVLLASITAGADTIPVLRADGPSLRVTVDGKPGSPWVISPDMHPFDELTTSAAVVKFACDIDSLTFTLTPWESRDFVVITAQGDSAFTRVTRAPLDFYLTPPPEYTGRQRGELLSKNAASFDVLALLHAITEIHPDPYTVTSSTELTRAFTNVLSSLPDSISVLDLYSKLGPIVTSIGDGHTMLRFPYNEVFTKTRLRLPLFVNVSTDGVITARTSLDSLIPAGARILSINGHAAPEMIEAMLPYAPGELHHFRMQRVDSDFSAWFEMLYPADSYAVEYLPEGASKPLSVTLPAVTWDVITERVRSNNQTSPDDSRDPYSFTIDPVRGVAVMDFRSFHDPRRMKAFADSMFTTLRKQGIDKLVIDVRENGGGNSQVGDVLLRYISPVPFIQMEKVYVRRSPFTIGIMEANGHGTTNPLIYLNELDERAYTAPLTAEEGHFDGKVWLVTSNYTFSSADSFANAFKHFGVGTVVGEETGGVNVAFGDLIYYMLPASGIPVSVSHKRFWLAGADEKDIHPVRPDVAVPRADALETAIRLASEAK